MMVDAVETDEASVRLHPRSRRRSPRAGERPADAGCRAAADGRASHADASVPPARSPADSADRRLHARHIRARRAVAPMADVRAPVQAVLSAASIRISTSGSGALRRSWSFFAFSSAKDCSGSSAIAAGRSGSFRVRHCSGKRNGDCPREGSPRTSARHSTSRRSSLGRRVLQAEPVEEPLQAESARQRRSKSTSREPHACQVGRRPRKTSGTGKPAARKSTGVKTPRRRKTPVPA